MSYTSEVAEEIDEVPSFVSAGTDDDNDVIVGEDVSGASASGGTDLVEESKKVLMTIKKAVIDTYEPKGQDAWKTKSLALTLVVGADGIDGKGRYKNKHFFPRIGLAVNRAEYDFSTNAAGKATTWYEPKDGGFFGEYNSLLKALGFSNNPAPTNDKAFRASLIGRQIQVDILQEPRQAKNPVTGAYENTDEMQNRLTNFKAVKVAVPEIAEAAAE